MSESDKEKLEKAKALATEAKALVDGSKLAEALPLSIQALEILNGIAGDEVKTVLSFCHGLRGTIYARLKRFDEALRDLNKAIELNPGDAAAYNSRGNVYSELNRREEALRDYDKTIELDAANAFAYNNRGNVYHALDRHNEALRDWNRAIELKPDYASPYGNRGGLFEQFKRYEEALRDLNKAIELEPNYAGAYSNRGNVHQGLGNFDKALRDYEQAIRLDPRDPSYYHNRALVFGVRAAKETEKKLKESYEKQLRRVSEPTEIAEAYRKRGQEYWELLYGTADEQKLRQIEESRIKVRAVRIRFLRRWVIMLAIFWMIMTIMLTMPLFVADIASYVRS